MCEHLFVMGAAGSPYAAFRRALDQRNLTRALAEAHDLPRVNLADALELLLLFRDQAALERYDLAAARWLGRFCVETQGVDLREAMFVLGALTALAGEEPRPGALALVEVARHHGLPPIERVLLRWLESDSTSSRSPEANRGSRGSGRAR